MNVDRNVAAVLCLVSGVVGGDDAQDIIAFRQLRGVPNTVGCTALEDRVCDFVKKACGRAAVDGYPTLSGVGDLSCFTVAWQAIEDDVDLRLFEAWRRCSIDFEYLVSEFIKTKTPPVDIKVCAIVRINYDAHWTTHQQSSALFLSQPLACRVKQLNTILLDCWRNSVAESNRRQRQRIDLAAGWSNVHV